MKLAILGAGALGCAMGGRMALAGHDVQLLARNQAHIDAINSDGLMLTLDGSTQAVQLRACQVQEAEVPVDLVLLLTKTFQSDDALIGAKALLDSGALVMSLQNGLGNADRLSRYVPTERVLIGMSMAPADLLGPGKVSTQSSGQTRFMFADGQQHQRGEEIAREFQQAGLLVEYGANIEARIWEKVAFNAATNGLLGVTETTPGILLQSDDAMALAKDIAAEAIAVARAKGIDANESGVMGLIELSSQKHPDHKPSMLQDLLAGRRTEVDSLNGAIVNEARMLGMKAPLNQTLLRLVRLCEARGVRRLS